MTRRVLLLSLCLLPFLPLTAQTPQMVAINTYLTGTTNGCIIDAGGGNANGTVYIQATDGAGHPLPFKSVIGGNSYQSVGNAIQRPVTNGAVGSVSLQWVTGASNAKIPYTFTFNINGHTTVYSNVDISPSFGSTFDWCSANLGANILNGPITIKGDPGTVTATGVNGDFLVPGNLSVGGTFAPNNVNAQFINAAHTNGVLNATFYSGSDIHAQVNSAFAACSNNCVVFIPAGTYNAVTTTLTMPTVTGDNVVRLVADPSAIIHYTGTNNAIETPQVTGGVAHLCAIQGGVWIGTASAKNGIHINVINQMLIDTVKITGFTNTASNMVGNGILDEGGNSITIMNPALYFNTTGLAGTERTNFASISVHVFGGEISSNTGWGVRTFDAHVSATQENSWLLEGTTIELNGSGGVDWAHNNSSHIKNCHFEQNTQFSVQLNNGYNGTGNSVEGSFFIVQTSSTAIYVVNGKNTYINGNYEVPFTTGVKAGSCFILASNTADVDSQHNTINSENERCLTTQGNPGWVYPQFDYAYDRFAADQNVILDSGATVVITALNTAMDLPGTGYGNAALVMLSDEGNKQIGIFAMYKNMTPILIGGTMSASVYVIGWNNVTNQFTLKKTSGTVPATLHYSAYFFGI